MSHDYNVLRKLIKKLDTAISAMEAAELLATAINDAEGDEKRQEVLAGTSTVILREALETTSKVTEDLHNYIYQ